MMIKKMILALILAATTATAAFADSDQSQDQNNGKSLTGSWTGIVTPGPGGPPPFRFLANFTADGGLSATADGDNSVGSPQYGVWERRGKNPRRFAATFLQLFYSPDATPTGSGKVRQTIILSPSGNEWEGPGHVEIFAADGTTLLFSGTATATATRIQSEPLP